MLPTELREGKVGSYWYHEDTQAFFDDADQYKMIKAMCKLSCSVCDKIEEQSTDSSKRRQKFRNIDQLKGHLFHRHKLFMCSLCLEGRKVSTIPVTSYMIFTLICVYPNSYFILLFFLENFSWGFTFSCALLLWPILYNRCLIQNALFLRKNTRNSKIKFHDWFVDSLVS